MIYELNENKLIIVSYYYGEEACNRKEIKMIINSNENNVIANAESQEYEELIKKIYLVIQKNENSIGNSKYDDRKVWGIQIYTDNDAICELDDEVIVNDWQSKSSHVKNIQHTP